MGIEKEGEGVIMHRQLGVLFMCIYKNFIYKS